MVTGWFSSDAMRFGRLFFLGFVRDIRAPHADSTLAHFPHRRAIAAEHVLEDRKLRARLLLEERFDLLPRRRVILVIDAEQEPLDEPVAATLFATERLQQEGVKLLKFGDESGRSGASRRFHAA